MLYSMWIVCIWWSFLPTPVTLAGALLPVQALAMTCPEPRALGRRTAHQSSLLLDLCLPGPPLLSLRSTVGELPAVRGLNRFENGVFEH
jgi:hypothetical protein